MGMAVHEFGLQALNVYIYLSHSYILLTLHRLNEKEFMHAYRSKSGD